MSVKNRWRYYLEDALDEWRHAPGPNILALATATVALFLAGLVLLGMQNVQQKMQSLRDNVPIEIFLTDEATAAQIEALNQTVATVEGVGSVRLVTKAEALEQLERLDPSLVEMAAALDSNPLPRSLHVRLATGADAASTEEQIKSLEASDAAVIEEVRLDRPWLERVEGILTMLRWALTVLGSIVLAAVVLVIASVLRLAVYARRHEINIMQWVGATPSFVRGPFLVAGLFQGLASTAFALLGIELTRHAILNKGASLSPALTDLIAGEPLALSGALLLVVLGLTVTMLGAFFAVRRAI